MDKLCFKFPGLPRSGVFYGLLKVPAQILPVAALLIGVFAACPPSLPAGETGKHEPDTAEQKQEICVVGFAESLDAGTKLHIVSGGNNIFERYTVAMLEYALAANGHVVTQSVLPELTTADIIDMETPPARILSKSESADYLLFLKHESIEEKESVFEMNLWDPQTQRTKKLFSLRITFPHHLADLEDAVPEHPPRKDMAWQKLFMELVESCDPIGIDTEKGRAKAEGGFFFSGGYWTRAADSFAKMTHEAATDCFLSKVMALKWSGSKDEAMKQVNEMLKIYPDSGPLYAIKTWLSLREGETEDALMLLEQARLSDVSRENYYFFARYMILQQDGKVEEAEKSLRKSAEALHDTVFIQLHAARHYWRKIELEKAVKFYRRAIDAGATGAEPYVELGLALDSAGDSKGAIKAFMDAFRHEKGDLSVARHLSYLLRSEGRYKDALKVLAECVDANPESAVAAVALGDLSLYGWRIDDSIEAYRKAVERDPESGYARVALACAFLLRRETDRAIEILDESLGKNRGDARTLLMLGEAMLHSRELSEAIKYLEAASRDSEHEYMARVALSNALLKIEDFNRAIREAQLAVSSKPDPITFAALGRAFLKSGRRRDARHAIEKGLRSFPDSPELLCTNIELLLFNASDTDAEEERLKLFRQALSLAEKTIDVDLFHLDSYLLGGYAALGMEDFEKCADLWKEAAKLDRWDADLAWKLARLYHDRLDAPERAKPHFERHIELEGRYSDEARLFLDR